MDKFAARNDKVNKVINSVMNNCTIEFPAGGRGNNHRWSAGGEREEGEIGRED